MIDEAQVIKRAKNGDERAFEELLTAYEKKIYNLAYRTCQKSHDAQDITQEVFLRVFRSIGGFKEESSFSTWLYRIASNMCIDYLRKASKSNTISLTVYDEDGEMNDMDIPDVTYTPEIFYEKLELTREIENALSKLSPEHRHIIIMRDINGLSYLEISEILNLQEGTVKSRLARARAKLASLILDGNYFGEKQSKEAKGGGANESMQEIR